MNDRSGSQRPPALAGKLQAEVHTWLNQGINAALLFFSAMDNLVSKGQR